MFAMHPSGWVFLAEFDVCRELRPRELGERNYAGFDSLSIARSIMVIDVMFYR